MKEFVYKLEKETEARVRMVEMKEADLLKKSLEASNILGEAFDCLKKIIVPYDFQDAAEEIHFFKNVKPRLCRDHVRERIELASQRRGLLPPPRDAAVQDVEDQCGENQRRREVDMPRLARFEIGHCREQRAGAADGIRQREPVRELELADHREELVRLRHRHRSAPAPDRVSHRLGHT